MNATQPAVAPPLQDNLRDAIRYWEIRRILYNLVLAAAAVWWVVGTWPHFLPAYRMRTIPALIVLAGLANLCYCAVYVVEALVQGAGGGDAWRLRRRWLWGVGMLLALLIENYWIADEIYPYVITGP